ncbi:MAG: hypothetical protein ACYTEQ_20645 [Planctomycetota bacterium]|jgi:hypothetical protein
MVKFDKKSAVGFCVVCLALVITYSLTRRSESALSTRKPDDRLSGKLLIDELTRAPWERWSSLLDAHVKRTETFVEALSKIAEDDKRDEEERIFAIMMMGKTKSETAIRFMFENITLRISVPILSNDDDAEKERPCWYTLKSMGWQVAPHAFEFLEQRRSATELELMAQLFDRIWRYRLAKAILEEKMKEFAGDPGKAEAIENIRQILHLMLARQEGEKKAGSGG